MEFLQKELKVRKRIDSIFNKERSEFDTKEEWDQYLEEREDVIFSLVEGEDVEGAEARIAEYARSNQDSILRNNARKAESQRQHAAAVARTEGQAAAASSAAAETAEQAAPAAAAAGYVATAQSAAGIAFGSAPMPVGEVPPDGGIPPPAAPPPGAAAGGDARQQWLRMALASGWTPDLPKRRAIYEAFSQVFVR